MLFNVLLSHDLKIYSDVGLSKNPSTNNITITVLWDGFMKLDSHYHDRLTIYEFVRFKTTRYDLIWVYKSNPNVMPL